MSTLKRPESGALGDVLFVEDRRKPSRLADINPHLKPFLRRAERETFIRSAQLRNGVPFEQLETAYEDDVNRDKGIAQSASLRSEVFELRDGLGISLGVIIGAVTWVAIGLVIVQLL